MWALSRSISTRSVVLCSSPTSCPSLESRQDAWMKGGTTDDRGFHDPHSGIISRHLIYSRHQSVHLSDFGTRNTPQREESHDNIMLIIYFSVISLSNQRAALTSTLGC